MRMVLIAAPMLLLAGCHDPFDWPGTWNATQVNAGNVAAQTADWRDLARGHGDPGADGQEAAAAVDRLRRGAVRPLADTSTSDLPALAGAPAAPNALPPGVAN